MEVTTDYGCCCYEVASDNQGEYAHIYNLYVKPEKRRQGRARKLLRSIIKKIRNTGYKGEIFIVAEPDNQSISRGELIKFYKSMGLTIARYY